MIVHGPLVATLLLDLLRRQRPDAQVHRFNFTATAPLFDIHRFSVCGKPEASSVSNCGRAVTTACWRCRQPPTSPEPDPSMLKSATDKYQDIRDAVRALCAEFPAEYHRKIDAQRAYPKSSSMRSRTPAGWPR